MKNIEVIDSKEELRASQIMEFGCPICGAAYDVIYSNKEGTLFQCSNKECKSGRPRIPFDKASKKCPKSAALIELVIDLRQKGKEINALQKAIASTQSIIDTIKNSSGREQHRMRRMKTAYNAVRDLKLFDKEGNRTYTKDNPFVVEFPEFNDVDRAIVYNIRTKRKVKTMLLAAWWCAKYNYSSSIDALADERKSIQKDRWELCRLQIERFYITKELKNKKVKLEYI